MIHPWPPSSSHETSRRRSLERAPTRLLWKLVQHQSKLEAELFQADKLAGLGSFAAGIAHDINNPLQLILGLAENLTDEQDLTVVHEQARDITEAVKRTSAICRDLTRYARRNGTGEDVMVNLNTKLDEGAENRPLRRDPAGCHRRETVC